MRVGLIRNPRSGRGANERSWPSLHNRLCDALAGSELICEETIGPGSAVKQAASLAHHGCEIVIAAGGDGTVCDVMQGVLGTPAALAVIPLGTGNDFARMIGLGSSVDCAITALKENRKQRVDVAHWRQGERDGHFLNVAGCGFDASVAERVNRGYRRLRGRSAYIAGVLQSLISYRPTMLSMCVDGERLRLPATLCAIANARSYGGGMQIAPNADLTDGLLDLVVIGKLGRLEFLANFPKVLSGKHLSHPKVSTRNFKSIIIESDPPAPFLIDGEMLPPGRLTVDVVPLALDVVVGRRR